MKKIIPLFCALLNKIADAALTYDAEKQEYVATWYGEPIEGQEELPIIHQIKFPKCSAEELKALIDKHNEVNIPVVTGADMQAEQDEGDAILESL